MPGATDFSAMPPPAVALNHEDYPHVSYLTSRKKKDKLIYKSPINKSSKAKINEPVT
jgi:hypothetical protein